MVSSIKGAFILISGKNLLKFSLLLFVITFTAIFALYLSMRNELPDINSLKNIQWQTPMQIYSSDGLLISQFGEKKRIPLTYEDTPKKLIDALLATEDDRFYLHFGVDPIGIGRAIFGKLTGQNKGGASTITMQVARNFFLTREVTYTRKIREIFLSFHIESLLTKNEILMLYINKIELGHRAFGFGAAAQVYYGKDINALNLAQIAVLAGLPKAPSMLNPIRSPTRAKARRAVVLKRMLVSDYITQDDYDIAKAAEITGKHHGAKIALPAPYIAEMANQKMIELYGKELAYTSGFKVFTTVSEKLQVAAQQALKDNLINYDQRHGYRGALFSLRPALTELTPGTSEINNPTNTGPALNNKEIDQPLTHLEMITALRQVNHYQNMVPAVVLSVNEFSAKIMLANQNTATIHWADMAWARAYISDQKQESPPKTADEILTVADVILVEKNHDDTYRLSQLPQASAAIVSLSTDNGAIQAAVGGFSFKQSQFNRVTQAKRQVGSNIKPFIYSAALEHDFTLASLVNDAPINQWDKSSGFTWRPKNSPEKYAAPMRIRLALAQSKNVVAVRLLKSVGLDNIINHLAAFGFARDELPRSESLALGSASLTPLEVAKGFASFANGGFLIAPYLIERIESAEGEIIYQANPVRACDPCVDKSAVGIINDEIANSEIANMAINNGEGFFDPESVRLENISRSNGVGLADPENISEQNSSSQTADPIYSAPRAISEQNAFLITEALTSVIWDADWSGADGWQGTGWRARTLKRRDLAGKTGTTNEAKDAWFSGYNRRIVTTSWIGFDDPSRNLGRTSYNNNLSRDQNQITGKEFGAKSAQPAWIDLMRVALTDLPFEAFQPPTEIVSVRIDKSTGKLTNKTDKSSRFEYFRQDSIPSEYINQDDSADIFMSEETEKEEELF